VTRAIVYGLLGAAAVVFPLSVAQIFLHTPIEREMGTVFKIFFFHLPLAWTMMLFAVVCGIAAAVQLRRRARRAEAVAIAAAEIVLLTGLGVLITGPIWAHATWGRAWTWDARQLATGLLWLVFAAYVLVRRYGGPGSERLAAALAILGAIDVPVIYYAVRLWRTTHPTTEVVGTLPRSMFASLWPALGAFLALCVALLVVRVRQEMVARDLDDAWARLDELGGAPRPRGVTA
jgi:heme exporter protein C